MKAKTAIPLFAALALVAGMAAAMPPMSASDVRALLSTYGYTRVDGVRYSGKYWTARAGNAAGNDYDLRIDPITRVVRIDAGGEDEDAKAPAQGLTESEIVAGLRASGYHNISGAEFEGDRWTVQAVDRDDASVVLEIDPASGRVIDRRD